MHRPQHPHPPATPRRGVRPLRALAALLTAATAALALGACGSTAPAGSAAGGGSGSGRLTVAFNTGISTIDPALACTTFDYAIVKNTYDNLVALQGQRDARGAETVVPALAQRWDTSADKRTYTFHLRAGATFASGNPVTADDVVYSLKRVLAKGGCQQYVLTTGDPKSIEKIEKVDASTVRITLRRADPLFLSLLAQTGNGVIDSKLLDQHGGLSKAGDQWLAGHTAGSGPYVLSSYEPDSAITLQARSGYWGTAPLSKTVDISIVTDPTTLETLVRSGQVNMAYGIPLKDLQSMKSAGMQVLAHPTQFYVYLGLDDKLAPLNDVRVRQALALAVPRQAIASRFGYGYVQTFDGPLPPAMPYSPKLQAPAPDLARAKALLASAGVKAFPLKLVVKSGESQQQEVATVIQGALAPLGVNVTVQTLGASAFSDVVDNFKAQSYIIKDGGTVNDPAYFLGYFLTCGNPFNWVQYCNKQVDNLLAQGRFEFDPAKRAAIYSQLSSIVARDTPMIPIFAPNLVVVGSSGLKGYVYHDDQQPVFSTISAG